MWRFLLLVIGVHSLDNGVARTPPMGWMSWTLFKCQTDCAKYPNACINDQLYQQMADKLVSDGYRDAGYNHIHVDDCWLADSRDSKGKLAANSSRFPNGMDGLAKYMHDRQLQFGIYEDVGKKTCAGYPGSEGHYDTDAQTFADWQVDYLKFDGCHYVAENAHIGYPAMQKALNKTGRSIIYSCEWALYEKDFAGVLNYTDIAENCNLWRNFNDVSDSWKSIHSIIKFFQRHQDTLAKIHGPGQWNDPDMLVAGNPGVTFDQAKAQFTIWAIWSAPLILSDDLRTLPDQYKQLLLNKDVIAVDQDPMGKMGKVVREIAGGDVLLYTKPMMPMSGSQSSYAIAALNTNKQLTHSVTVQLSSLGLNNANGYQVKDLYSGQSLGTLKPSDSLKINSIPTTGAAMFKATIVA